MAQGKKIERILRGLKACHDQKRQIFIKSNATKRLTLFQQYAAHYDLPVPQNGSDGAHNILVGHLDQHHPMWRGYDPYILVRDN